MSGLVSCQNSSLHYKAKVLDELFRSVPKSRLLLFRNADVQLVRGVVAGSCQSVSTSSFPPGSFVYNGQNFVPVQKQEFWTVLTCGEPRDVEYVLCVQSRDKKALIAAGVAPNVTAPDFSRLQTILESHLKKLQALPVLRSRTVVPDFDFSKQHFIIFHQIKAAYLQHPMLLQKQKTVLVVFMRPADRLELTLFAFSKAQQILQDCYFLFVFQGVQQEQLEKLNEQCAYIRQLNVIEDRQFPEFKIQPARNRLFVIDLHPAPVQEQTSLPVFTKRVRQQPAKPADLCETKELFQEKENSGERPPEIVGEFSTLQQFLKSKAVFEHQSAPFSFDFAKKTATILGVEIPVLYRNQEAARHQFLIVANPRQFGFEAELEKVLLLKELLNGDAQMFVFLQGVSAASFAEEKLNVLANFNVILDDQNLVRVLTSCYGVRHNALFLIRDSELVVEGKTVDEAEHFIRKALEKEKLEQFEAMRKDKYRAMREKQQSSLSKAVWSAIE